MPLTRLVLALVSTLGAVALHAEPFILSDLNAGAARFSVQEISVGGAPDGFLLAGSSSHHAVTVPLSVDGNPLMIGRTRIAEGQGMRAEEPVRIGSRWVVPITTGFRVPDVFMIAEMRPDGSLLGEPHAIPWERVSGGSISWNGRTLLMAAMKRRTTTVWVDLVVRTANSDFTSVGEERVIARRIWSFRVVPADDGFVIVFSSPDGIYATRLSDDGAPIGPLHQLSTATTRSIFDVSQGANGTLVVWAEGSSEEWSLRAATISGDTVTGIPLQIPSFPAFTARYFARQLDGGFVLAWQPVDQVNGRLVGRAISWMQMDADGTLGDVHEISGLPGGELLLALGSNGDTALMVWERHVVGVGTPLYGATISDSAVSPPRVLSLDYSTIEAIDVASHGDGSTFAAWREMSATETTLFAGRWTREGRRYSLQPVVSVEGSLGNPVLVTGGGNTLLLWRQGYSLLGAWLAEDASLLGEPFVIERGDNQSQIADRPAAAWDGVRFIVTWVEYSGSAPVTVIAGATLTPSGVVKPLGVLVEPPLATARWQYSVMMGRIAANSGGAMIVAEVQQQYFCSGIPCPTEDHIGIVRLDRDGRPLGPNATLISSGSSPDLASDGRNFLVSWQSSEGTRVRLFGPEEGRPGVDRLLLSHPFLESTRTVWNGSEYVVAWGGPRIYLARLDRALRPIQPIAVIEGHSSQVGSALALGALPGDAFVSWIDTLADPAGARAVVADFASESVAVPPPPAAPTGVTFRRTNSPSEGWAVIDISWNPVTGAEGYWIETYGPHFEGFGWFRTLLVMFGEADSAQISDYGHERIRIRAYGVGGSSEPVESSLIAPRRRGVRR